MLRQACLRGRYDLNSDDVSYYIFHLWYQCSYAQRGGRWIRQKRDHSLRYYWHRGGCWYGLASVPRFPQNQRPGCKLTKPG